MQASSEAASSHAEHHPDPAEPTVQPALADDSVSHVEAEPTSTHVSDESGEKTNTETQQTQENHDCGDVGNSSTASPPDAAKDPEHFQENQEQHDTGSTHDAEHTKEQSQADTADIDTNASKPVPAVSQEPQQVSQDTSDRIDDGASTEKTSREPEHARPDMNAEKHETHEPQHANGDMNAGDEAHVGKTTQNTNQVEQVDEHHDKGQHIQTASSDEKTRAQFLISIQKLLAMCLL